jgi:hypothetical protein
MMKQFIVLGGLLLAQPGAAQSTKPAPAPAAPTLSPDGRAVIAYLNEIGAFLRQVLATPNDTQALITLHGPKLDRLKQRHQQIQPVLARWRRSLSKAQMEAAYAHFMQDSQFAKDIEWLKNDAATTARLQRNPSLQAAIGRTLEALLVK